MITGAGDVVTPAPGHFTGVETPISKVKTDGTEMPAQREAEPRGEATGGEK